MNTGSNRQICEFVCTIARESACDECKLQGAQNMMEAVWQLSRKQFCKTYSEARIDTSVFERPLLILGKAILC